MAALTNTVGGRLCEVRRHSWGYELLIQMGELHWLSAATSTSFRGLVRNLRRRGYTAKADWVLGRRREIELLKGDE